MIPFTDFIAAEIHVITERISRHPFARCSTLLMTLTALALLSGCDRESPDQRPSDLRLDLFVFQPEAFDMSMSSSTGSDATTEIRGFYGDPCEEDADCLDRICVSAGDRKICSTSCILECDPFPEGQAAYCRSDPSRGRIEFVCYPNQDLLCQPCINDTQCDGSPCIETNDGLRCSKGCAEDADCPEDFMCQSSSCVPRSGSCDCNTESEGASRICEISNDFGTCIGEETCDPEQGWSGCNAKTPEAELCDGVDQNCDGIPDDGIVSEPCTLSNEYGSCEGVAICLGERGTTCYGDEPAEERCDEIDNDCDGMVDEGFTLEDGRYGSDEHCGRCGLSCARLIPFATQTQCDSARDLPQCIVLACEAGYQTLDGEVCVPASDVICEPCTDNASCSTRSPGSACVAVGDPEIPETVSSVCGRDCGPESAFGQTCPMGFECQAVGEGVDASLQCLPSAGHCLCIGQPEGFSIPCEVTSPLNDALVCRGRRSCEGGGFGECVLPEEVCDGIDNDCDGVIDNQFLSPEGRYDLDTEHCGRCNFSCDQFNYPNAESVCERALEVPRCEMRCVPGFIDLDNGSDDGCECEVIPGDDLPDGLDQNCDGIDGDRQRALFVSKVGDDQAVGSAEDPLLTISRALELASAPNVEVRDIYVATGVYSENITLVNGVSVYGGYALDFRERDSDEHPTTLFGQPPEEAYQGTITAIDITEVTYVDGFSVYGVNASISGANSVAIALIRVSQNLTLSHNQIIAGNGAPGGRGDAGISGAFGDDGTSGDDALASGSSMCLNQQSDGGDGGVRTCGGASVRGGGGGEGRCPISQDINGNSPCSASNPDACRNSCDASPCDPLPPPQGVGEAGSGPGQAEGGAPTYDRWNNAGLCYLCGLFPQLTHLGQPGADGPNGVNGAPGAGCSQQGGALTSELRWETPRGGAGGAGEHGTGGGGGSAGSGYDATGSTADCIDTIGGAGGGGGSGGCGGASGIGGQGGGGSFAILIAYGQGGAAQGLPILAENRILRGVGGQGGAGGSGGIGGLGGEGADGGIASQVFCAEPGGRGGNGGDGGHGGGGGGGCGGIAASIYIAGAGGAVSTDDYTNFNDFDASGRAGLGGVGGGSTGNPGGRGADGLLVEVLVVD